MPLNVSIGILVVDDMPTMRKVLTSILKPLGFKKFYEAKDGIEALKILKDYHKEIDLVMADWNMPKLSGMDLWRKMKESDEYQHIKFIMISSESERANIMSALKEGITNYILKPFEPRIVKEKIEKLFS